MANQPEKSPQEMKEFLKRQQMQTNKHNEFMLQGITKVVQEFIANKKEMAEEIKLIQYDVDMLKRTTMPKDYRTTLSNKNIANEEIVNNRTVKGDGEGTGGKRHKTRKNKKSRKSKTKKTRRKSTRRR